jgi:hypothetical protein
MDGCIYFRMIKQCVSQRLAICTCHNFEVLYVYIRLKYIVLLFYRVLYLRTECCIVFSDQLKFLSNVFE